MGGVQVGQGPYEGGGLTFGTNSAQGQLPKSVQNASSVLSFIPENYGAKGDGATDDTAAIISMLNAAAGTGGTCFFSRTYVVSSINLTISNLSLQGLGAAKIISNLPFATTSPVLWLIGSNIHIRDLTITHSITYNIDTNGGQVYTNGPTASTIRLGYSGSNPTVTDVSVERCTISYSRNTSIFIGGATRVRVLDNTCNEQGQGICVADVTDCVVRGNIIYRSVDDLIAVLADTGIANSTDPRVIVEGNSVSQGYAQGIDVTGADGITITGNTVDTTYSHGILAYQYTGTGPTGPVYRASITGNVVKNAARYFGTGQYKTTANGSAQGIAVIGQRNITVASNTVYNSTNYGIYVDGVTDCAVTGNQVSSSGSYNFNVSASAPSSGVTIVGNSSSGANGIIASGTTTNSIKGIRIANNNIRGFPGRAIGFSYLAGFAIEGNLIYNDAAGTSVVVEFPAATSTPGVSRLNAGFNPVGVITAPAVPNSGVYASSTTAYYDCLVYVTINTDTKSLLVNSGNGGPNQTVYTGPPTAATVIPVFVPAGGSLAWVSNGAFTPVTWVWYAN